MADEIDPRFRPLLRSRWRLQVHATISVRISLRHQLPSRRDLEPDLMLLITVPAPGPVAAQLVLIARIPSHSLLSHRDSGTRPADSATAQAED
eukprot:6203253-Pleurochrysis_carterae.AAC.7